MMQEVQSTDERALQSLLLRFPQIVEGLLLKKRLPISELEVLCSEDVCSVGRIDLAFRERTGKSLVLVELQLGLADRDHYDRLASYVADYEVRFPTRDVIGAHLAERFPKALLRYGAPLYSVRFHKDIILQQAQRLESRDEELFGLSLPKPPVHAFAKLSYLNGFIAFMANRPFATYRQVVENVPSMAKNLRQIRNPEYRARLWIRFGESFGLVTRTEGRIELTTLGRAFAASLDEPFLWSLSRQQRRVLIAGLSAARCTNGHKFGIFCLLKAVEQSEETAFCSRDKLTGRFVSLCSSRARWARVSQKASFTWYCSYVKELGLCDDSEMASGLVLTPIGRELLGLLSRQYAAFELERRLLLRSSRRLF